MLIICQQLKTIPTGPKYDITNIPLELQTELSQYFAYLVNDVRQQLGKPKLVVNTDTIKFATLVAENMKRIMTHLVDMTIKLLMKPQKKWDTGIIVGIKKIHMKT